MKMGTGTGTVTETGEHHGQNGTLNREVERPVRARRTTGRVVRKEYVGRGCEGVLGVLSGEKSQYGLGIIISETVGTAN